jgi:hypothetical protein
MAHGSCRAMHAYVNRVFDLRRRLHGLTDSRSDPTVPQGPVLQTWFWALAKRLPSTEQVGDLLQDRRWRKLVELADEAGGSPDTAGRVLDQLSVKELNELLLGVFFAPRRAGVLRDGGPFGVRCAIIDMNELFSSEKIHCPDCQVREKTVGEGEHKRVVKEYFHQAVALVWAGEVAWPIGWELLIPGEGELTAAKRLLTRLLPRLRKGIDLVLGDALYCCRDFFSLALGHKLGALAICSGQTEMDQEMDLFIAHEVPEVGANRVARWCMVSEAWKKDIKSPLRVMHYENQSASKSYRNTRKQLRIVTTAPVELVPVGQGWGIARCRWWIENGTFNILTRDYSLEHNYRHSEAAIVALLVFRSLGYCLTQAYWRFAAARSRDAPRCFLVWWTKVLVEDWVRYLDAPQSAPAIAWSG